MTGLDGPSLRELTEAAVRRLAAAGIESPEVDARLLARALLGADAHREPGRRPSAAQATAFSAAVARRAAREPLQLVLGTVAFHDVELSCRPGVFVPRPETEVLVELALAAAARSATARRRGDRSGLPVRPDGPVHVVEACTGSGAVALAMAAARAGLEVVATERSPVAVAAARANRDRLRSEGRLASPVEVVEGDLLDPVDAGLVGRIDVLVANPPYLPEHDLASLPPEVADHDPVEALIGGPDGHEVVDRLLDLAPDWLAPGGTVVLELDARRAPQAAAVARGRGLVDVAVHHDLTGRARFVSGRRPDEAHGVRTSGHPDQEGAQR